ALAPLYELDPAAFGSELEEVHMADGRPGVFTRVGFLAAFAHVDRPSPILRGAHLQRRVLCLDVGPPPPEGPGTPLPTAPELVTNRQRVEAQTSAPECNGCHSILNASGYVLEVYDATGALRIDDNGAPLDTDAVIWLAGDE